MKSISRFLLLVLLVLVVLAGFIFIINNDEQTALWLVIELPPRAIGLWVLAAFIAGGLVGMLLGYGFWSKLKIRMQLMTVQKKLQQSQQENTRLQQLLKTFESPDQH